MDRLQANQQLNVNDQLVPQNGTTHLLMQGDGNLVLYRNDNGRPLWASNTWNLPVTHAIMQGDGNFVCYSADGHPYYATGTDSHPGAWIVLQDDGNLVVYSASNNPLWASGTVQNWDPFTTDTGDVHVGTGNWMHSWASMASTGLISGHTRTWCTVDLRGFTGSTLAFLLDVNGKVIWPADPDASKHRYGVDGVWIGTHDRTDYWANQVDAAIIPQAKSLACVQYYDPKNRLLADIHALGQTIQDLLPLIQAVASA
jgi:hypothetical protein